VEINLERIHPLQFRDFLCHMCMGDHQIRNRMGGSTRFQNDFPMCEGHNKVDRTVLRIQADSPTRFP